MISLKQKTLLIALLTAGVLFFCFTPASAQDQFPRPEDLLRWFPLGDYDLIVHKDYQSLQEAFTWEIYNKLFDPFNSWIKIDFQLPRPLQDDILSATMCQALRIRTAVFDSPEKAEKYKYVYGDMLTSEVINDKIYKFESVGERLYVFRYLYAEDKITQALRTGKLVSIKKKLYDRPIYSYSAVIAGESREFFLYVSETQEVIIASTLNTLVRMIHTGRGYFLALVDGRDYQDLPYLSNELGNSWQFTSFAAHYRALLYRMRISDVSVSKMDQVRTRLLEAENYMIKSVSLSESMSFRAIHSFGTLTRAFDWYQKNKYSNNIDFLNATFFNRDFLLYFQPGSNQLYGNSVVSEVIYQGKSIENLEIAARIAPDRQKQEFQLLDQFRETKERRGTPAS